MQYRRLSNARITDQNNFVYAIPVYWKTTNQMRLRPHNSKNLPIFHLRFIVPPRLDYLTLSVFIFHALFTFTSKTNPDEIRHYESHESIQRACCIDALKQVKTILQPWRRFQECKKNR